MELFIFVIFAHIFEAIFIIRCPVKASLPLPSWELGCDCGIDFCSREKLSQASSAVLQCKACSFSHSFTKIDTTTHPKIVHTVAKQDTLLYLEFPPWGWAEQENEQDDHHESCYLMHYGKALKCYDCQSGRSSYYLIIKHVFYHSELTCKTSELLTCSWVSPCSIIFINPCRTPGSCMWVVFVPLYRGCTSCHEAMPGSLAYVLGQPRRTLQRAHWEVRNALKPFLLLLNLGWPKSNQFQHSLSVAPLPPSHPRGCWVWMQEPHLSHAGAMLWAVGSTGWGFMLRRDPLFHLMSKRWVLLNALTIRPHVE